MNLVRAALRHGVHDAAGGPSEFSRVVRCRHLEFAHRVRAERVGEARTSALLGEKCLRVVAAIDRVAVQQAGDAAKAHQSEVAIGRGARRHQRKRRPPPRVGGEIRDGGLVDVRGEVGLLGVDDRRLGAHLHGLDLSRDAEHDVQIRGAAYFDDDVLALVRAESAEHHRHRVHPGLQVDDGEMAGCICRRVAGGVGSRVAHGHAGAGNDRFGLVCDDAADGAFSIRLRRDASRGTEQDSEQADRAKARRSSQIHHRDLHMLETRNILDRRCCDDAKNRRPRATRRTITVRYGQAPIHR